MKSIIQASPFRIRGRRIGRVLSIVFTFGTALAADLDNDGLPDDWEALHAGTFAVWPPDLDQTLLPHDTAARSFLLSNDTAVAVNFTATLSNNTVLIYGAYDSITGGVTYAWDEISSTGNRLSTISAADDDTETVTITGFTFPFYGTNYSQVHVSSNGLLTFGYADTSPGNNQIPGSAAPSNTIAAFWDDLDTRTTGDIYYKVETNRLIIQYQNVGRYSGTGSYTFQVVLHSNGTLNLRYKTMTGTLDSASIGIEGNNQWEGVGIVHDAAYVANSLALEIETFSEFFSMPTLTGLVPAYSVASLDGYFDSLSLPPGLYTADVSVAHTGAGTSPLGLSANLTVLDQPGSVSIISPSSNISVMQGEMLWIVATATDPDGMEKVEFYDGATKIGEIYSSPGYDYHSFGWYVDTNGSRSITAKGIDYFGGVSVSSAVTVSATANVDYDGMPDSWEIANYLDPNDPNDGSIDADLDGYTNLEEYQFGLDPQYPEDIDFDGMPDGWEYHNGTDINTDDGWVDTDTDGLTNIEEYWYGTNPLTFDTDGDRLPDLWEINNWLDPLTFSADDDADLDGLTNLEEFLNQTNPSDEDSDGDGKSDGEEVDQGSNPNDPADGGNPPPDPLESVEFVVGGDYASWRMEIKSLGPRDTRTLLVVSPAPNQWETKSHKLWKNNKYEITMHHTGSRPQDDPPWYCWEGQIEGKPGLETFETLPDWQLGARNTDGKYFTIKDHWVVDNRDGLLTSHLHSKLVNHVTGKKATFTPVTVDTAEIRTGQFVVKVPDVPVGVTGTLNLLFRRKSSETDDVVVKTLTSQAAGDVNITLDSFMDQDPSPLDGFDTRKYDRVQARWRSGTIDVKSGDKKLDVHAVEVLTRRKISNYFSPTWGGSWSGTLLSKGVYAAGSYPGGLYNADRRTSFLNALDPANEGLAMDGNTVIRDQIRAAVTGHNRVSYLNGTDYGYIEFPDRDQDNASSPHVTLLRSTSAAVRVNADRLSYTTEEEVYVPSFSVRTVDDTGGLHGNTDQIDVWRGQGDETLQITVNNFGLRNRTCLKIIKAP